MRIGLKEALEINKEDNRVYRKRYICLIILMAALFFVFLNEKTNGIAVFVEGESGKFFTPAETWSYLGMQMKYHFCSFFHIENEEVTSWMETGRNALLSSLPVTQLKRLLISMACGALLALSGNIFQNVFRNPMAAPTMLGVNTGVNVAMLYLAITYGSAVTAMPGVKYKYCFFGAACMLAMVMLLGKIASGRHRFAVDDLLLVGVASTQIINAVVTGYTQALDTDVLAVYQMLSSGASMDLTMLTVKTMTISFCACMIPMYLLRFSFNVVSNTPDETRGLGIDSNMFRFVTLIIGTFMMIAAMVHCGAIGMVSLAVPFIGRGMFGPDFRKQYWGNMLLGALFLLLCRGISNLLPWIGYEPFPISMVINVVVPPIFAVAIFKAKRVWD